MSDEYDTIFQRQGARFNVDWRLLKAIAMKESSLNPFAINRSDPSVGMMQILCSGYPGSKTCQNRFNIQSWPPQKSEDLLNAETNIFYGAQILSSNIKAYGFRKGVAVYNNWSARLQEEPFSNQGYLDTVIKIYGELIA